MTITKALAHGVRAGILSFALAGCAYDTGAVDWHGAYAANGLYDNSFYDGAYGPDFFIGDARHPHWDEHHIFHDGHHDFGAGMAHSGGFRGFHFGGSHIAHAGGFGGHGRA